MLCSDDAYHGYLVHQLHGRFPVAAVVVEPAASQRRRLLKSRRYKDYLYAVYHFYRRRLLGLERYRRRYFAVDASGVLKQPTLTVPDINCREVGWILRDVCPDIAVVMGTSIILRDVLLAACPCVINIHGGYVPDYRGNHCFFFALYNGHFSRIGSTIHFVDTGINTGDINERVQPPIYADDNAERVYCRAAKLAVNRLVEHILKWENGQSFPRDRQLSRGKLYLTRDRAPCHDNRD